MIVKTSEGNQSQGWDLNCGSPEYKPGVLAISLRYSVNCSRIDVFIFNLLFLFYEDKMAVLMASSCPIPVRNSVDLIFMKLCTNIGPFER
jgi:hypothetical protein